MYSKPRKVKKSVVEYSNNRFTSEEASVDNNEDSIVTYDTPRVAYQHPACLFAEGYSSQDEDPVLTFKRETCSEEEYQSICAVGSFFKDDVLKEKDKLAYLSQNAVHFTCESPTEARQSDSEQLVPQSDHLYANVQKKVDVVTRDAVPQIGMETEQPHIEDHYQEREALPHSKGKSSDSLGSDGVGEEKLNSTLESWLDDSQLEFVCEI